MRKVSVVFLALLITGCASIISKSQYPVTVSTNPSGAKIIITNSQGIQVFNGTTPNTVTLNAKKGFFSGQSYTIRAEMEGYETSTISLTPGVDGWYVANILFGGVIGLLIVDPATGAMWKLDENVALTLIEGDGSSATGSPQLRIMSIRELPVEFWNSLVPLR